MQKLTTIRTVNELNGLMDYLKDKDFIALDTETTGVLKESNIIGYSVSAEVDVGFYVIIREWDVKEDKVKELETLALSNAFFQSLKGKNLILHNAVFDCWMIENNFQVSLIEDVHTDTMILGHLLNENRSNGLKERAVELYGEDSTAEQAAMKASVIKNGGVLTKDLYELYKADADLIAHYGAKDAILTLKLFYHDVPILFEEGLDKFFYEEESMPLLRGPTYDMNTTGLRIDTKRLQTLKQSLITECAEAEAFILKEIHNDIKDKYPGGKKSFNIGSNQQLSWLLFHKLGNEFGHLTEAGKEVCEALNLRPPYTRSDKVYFMTLCAERVGTIWQEGHTSDKDHICKASCKDYKTGKKKLAKKVKDPWQYTACDIEVLAKFKTKYKWVERLLEYKKNQKILSTYVEGIQERMQYSIVRPNFLQHGTTSGRYSCKNPNFQNLPRDDKRVKSCIISRTDKVFVGADHSQLEPRVFSSQSGDHRLQASFHNKEDFYSVIGVEVYNKKGCSLRKEDKNSFAELYPKERHYSKQFGLAGTYGANAHRLSKITGRPKEEMEFALNAYFEQFPQVRQFMLSSHEEAKKNGRVLNLFGRPRRMPLAKSINQLYGETPHDELPYEFRNVLNLAVNHKVQSTGASIMNRGAIKVWKTIKQLERLDDRWKEVKIVLQVHDQLVLEGPQELEEEMKLVLQEGLETAVILPGVDLVAIPFASNDLAGQK